MTGIACSGDYCDNIQMECAELRDAVPDNADCRFVDISEEVSPSNHLIMLGDQAIVSIQCSGTHCDNKRIKYCRLTARGGGSSIDFETSDELPAVRCPVGLHVSSFGCAGRFCDNVSISCNSERYEEIGERYNTPWVENAGHVEADCGGGVMVGVGCSGDFCDNIQLECAVLRDVQPSRSACTVVRDYSEEALNAVRIPNDHAITAIECSGTHCDNKRITYCALQSVGERSSSSVPYVARMVSEEGGGPPSYCYEWNDGAIGFVCQGEYCDNIRLVCEPFPNGISLDPATNNWSEFFSEEGSDTVVQYPRPLGWYSVSGYNIAIGNNAEICNPLDSGGIVQGLKCRGSYCDAISIECSVPRYPDGRPVPMDAAECEWLGPYSEEDIGIDFNLHSRGRGSGTLRFVAGIECSGSYCDNKRFLVCPIR